MLRAAFNEISSKNSEVNLDVIYGEPQLSLFLSMQCMIIQLKRYQYNKLQM